MRIPIDTTEETRISIAGDWTIPEADRLSSAWFQALNMDHKLPDYIRYLDGMSGKKYRYLINRLVENTPDARYLEIGSWAGSTACSAIWGNKVKATCIDNWSDFGGPKQFFLENIAYCTDVNLNEDDSANIIDLSGNDIDFTFIENDFRKITFKDLGKHNIYLYDGPHEKQDQYDGISFAQHALEDTYILVVDDWNDPNIRIGTEEALSACNNEIIARIDILTTTNGSHPKISHQMSDWHNGYFLAVIKKP